MLVVGFATGELPRIPAERVLIKNLTIEGVGFGGVIGTVPGLGQQVVDHIVALHRAQPFVPAAAQFARLEEAGAVLGRLVARTALGKQFVRP
jgi:NADPH2:quinone reductase